MSGGIIFDAYALSFGLTLGAIAGLVYALRAKHHRPKVHDWAEEWPEFAHSKDGHVKIVPYAYHSITWPDGPRGRAIIQHWEKP